MDRRLEEDQEQEMQRIRAPGVNRQRHRPVFLLRAVLKRRRLRLMDECQVVVVVDRGRVKDNPKEGKQLSHRLSRSRTQFWSRTPLFQSLRVDSCRWHRLMADKGVPECRRMEE